ncbi:kinase-like protein [Trametes cingulata]|nr:kinase-like protein [Trametes cingulata]
MGHDDIFLTRTELASVELFIIDLREAQVLRFDEGHGRVGPNGYRAPEVTLGLPWSYGVDAFAAGCILTELCLGRPLFHYTECDLERLALLERVLGPFPAALAKRAEKRRPGFFALDGPVRVCFPPQEAHAIGEEHVRKVLNAVLLTRLIYDSEFLELAQWLLCLDPKLRSDITECYALSFLLSHDDDIVCVEPDAIDSTLRV